MKKIFILSSLLTIFLGTYISVYAQLIPPTDLTATEITFMDHKAVKLEWQGNSQMERYNVYKKHGAISEPGDFIKIANHIMHRSFLDHIVLPDSTYSYYVTAVNQTSESDPSNTVEITIGAGNQNYAVVTGTLYDEVNNEPIANGKVRFTEANSCHGPMVYTNEQGEFIVNLEPGEYYMRSMAMLYLPEFYDNVPTIELATLITITTGDSLHFDVGLTPITPPTLYTLSGNVSDISGNPLRARIMVTPVRSNTYYRHQLQRWAITDSLGNYSIPVKEGDTVVVFCRPFNMNLLPEYYDNKQTFAEADRLPVTGNLSGIDFIIEPAPVYDNGISGIVENELNEGVAAHIAAFNLNGGHHMKKYRTVTDSLGNYIINNMVPAEYILLAIPHDEYMPTFFRYDGQPTLNWHEADSVAVGNSGIVQGIDFIVHPFNLDGYAQVTGTVKDYSGSVINGAVLFALDQSNNIITYALSNSNGEFVMQGFEAGTYKIYGDKFGFELEQSFNVTLDYFANSTADISIILTPETVTANEEEIIAEGFVLEQNYPNPFNPVTTIKYQIAEPGLVTLKVYDLLGREIETLVNSEKATGNYEITWNAENIPSGVYFYTMQASSFSETRKMLLMK